MAVTEADVLALVQSKGYATDTAVAQGLSVQSAWRRTIGKRRWPFLEATAGVTATAGTETVAIAGIADLGRVEAVRLSQGTETFASPAFVERGRLRDWLASDVDRSTPTCWTLHAGTLLLYPRPDRAYTVTIDYKRRPTYDPLDILFPDDYIDVLAWGTVSEMAFRQRDYNAATYAEGQYADRAREMAWDFGIEQRQGSREVGHSDVWDRIGY